MDLFKFGVKIFIDGSLDKELGEFIPVFHGWIQGQSIEGHLLLDVHDYSHVPHGPGILLVAHEGNFSLDESGGRCGLVYYRKQPAGAGSVSALCSVFTSVQAAARLLEENSGVKFNIDSFEVFANDRLIAPNNSESARLLQPVVADAVREAFGSDKPDISVKSGDPRERLTFLVKK